ncbi:nitroreductase family protein [candidate division KSB1 bacterium]|nr:nitroreductase family protein [candidate division KSB1 bacterium]
MPFDRFALNNPKDQIDKIMRRNSGKFLSNIQKRRSVRRFSDKPVSIEIIKNCIAAAGSAPSGANKQPWHFAVVSDPEVKRTIRREAEKIERDFYQKTAPEEWLQALKPLGTDENKEFLEIAPYLIVVFMQRYGIDPGGGRVRNYYPLESVGLATGILLTALHFTGLGTLTYTPAKMNFLNTLLNRPGNERPFVILVVGHPAEGVFSPDIAKKSLHEITSFF